MHAPAGTTFLVASIVPVLLEITDGLAFATLLLLFWIPYYWLLVRPAIRTSQHRGKRASALALAIWLASAAALTGVRHWLFAWRIERNSLTWVAGAALWVFALWMEAVTRRALGWRRLLGLPELNPRDGSRGVVATGIYARVRHPRYLLYMLMLVSVALLTGAVPIFLLAILNILMYQVLAGREERALIEQYGREYESYRRSVPRFLPSVGRRAKAPLPP